MILSTILMTVAAGIPLAIGCVHLLYTFSGSKLLPRDPAVQLAMARTHPGITRQTTMWRAWVGFNATHSMALILFGVFFVYLALAQGAMLFASAFLLALGLAVLVSFLVLARIYFFSIPFKAISISLACYVASVVIAFA
jgi:hypothetical protein